MSLALNGTNGVTYNDGTQQSSAPGGKNLIINGNMQIAQRGTSVAGISSSNGYQTVDRFLIRLSNAGTFTMSQDTDAPSGFSNSLKWACTTADAPPAAGDFAILQYRAEGQDLQQLAFGTPSAKQFTVSFWVKSSETGTAVLRISAPNSGNVMQGHTYTISSANTWEKKTITFTANTSDVIPNNNLIGLNLYWYLATGTDRTSGTLPTTTWEAYLTANEAVGQTINIAASTSSYFNITGVQLETGETATDFENLQYGQQLALCQRYYWKYVEGLSKYINIGCLSSSSVMQTVVTFPTTMRTTPTLDHSTGTNYYGYYGTSGWDDFNNLIPEYTNLSSSGLYNASQVSGTAGHGVAVATRNASAYISFDAEL